MLLLHRGILIGFTWLIYGFVSSSTAAIDEIINEHEGKTVVLPCPVSIDKCGELHSINWFKGDDRIAALLLDDSNVTMVAPEFEERVTVEQNPYRVVIKDLQIADEDVYLCDTTFFIPVETCDNYNGYRVELNVLVPPAEVVILDEKGDRIENGSVVGPMEERQTLKTSCVVRNTRPQPAVGWWRGKKRLTTHSPSYDEKDGLFTATLELELQLSRDDLAQEIECRVESAAIDGIMENSFTVDLQVRPTSITINGVEHHTVQGSKVVLTCDIHGARPAVNLTWYNTTEVIGVEENDLTEIRTKAFEKEDGTYHTQSELMFNATRFENDRIFRCDAENIVIQTNREKPFTSSLTLEVLYPPVVKVSPSEITVNTSDTVLLNCEYEANPASLSKVVWYRGGDVVNVNNTERYEGGNSENVALVIRSTDKDDIGNYTCQLSNAIGKGVSAQQIDLDVQYVPVVEVLMIPEGPVKESDESNVTLYCNILEANPATLTKVRWYANSTLLKELPDCEETKEDLCHIDPSKLLLESIGRGFFYNYSCEGYNAAGWGPRSDDKELMVYYEPGPATLTHFPLIAVKKKSVTFSCSVEDPGYPESNRFRWMRGGRGPLQDIVTKDWTVEPVVVDSRTNYSCYAYNEGGRGVAATVNLEVHAPPFFIKNLSPYTGRLHSSTSANLTCRIECVPRCDISWLKDGVPIEPSDARYFVKEKYMDASPATGDFESMLSVLHFNMSNWPNKKFDIEADNANYTCLSSANTVGPGIKSATYFSIEYAPDNTTVSEEVVYVHEDTIPGRVICKSKANPEPTYEWRFNNKTVTRGNALIINSPMARNDSGHYVCVAFNKHGRSTAQTFIDVQFKPRCEIERREIDGQDALICTAFGNPEEADFSWSIKAENESVEWLGNNAYRDKSWIIILDEDSAIARTYRCVANNTVGPGPFCEIEVAEQLAWWQRWDKTTLIILVASILALLLAVIIICCIIICVCRRRRRQDKYHTDVSISATHSVLSYQPTTAAASATDVPDAAAASDSATAAAAAATATAATDAAPVRVPDVPRSPPRWPLRPGVMVHVRHDTKKNLAANRMTLAAVASPPAVANRSQSAAGSANNTLTSQSSSALSATPSIVQLSLTQPATPSHPPTPNQSTTRPQAATLGRIPRSSKRMLRCGAAAERGRPLPGAVLNAGYQSLPRHVGCSFDFAAPATACVAPNNSSLTTLEVGIPVEGAATIESRPTAPPPLPKRLPPRQATASISIADVSTHSNCELLPRSLLPKVAAEAVQIQPATADDSEVDVELQETAESKLHDGRSSSKRLKECVERCWAHLFTRTKSGGDGTRDSQRSHVGLLGVLNGAGGFWRRSSPNPFATEHRLKGIRCSGSVSYKKTQLKQQQRTASDAATAVRNPSATLNDNNEKNNNNNNNNNDSINNNNNNCSVITTLAPNSAAAATASPPSKPKSRPSVIFQISFAPQPPPPPPCPPLQMARKTVEIHDKSSSLADPLTEPGEYENLPFHGLQTAPNKFCAMPTNFNNSSNVVRVAPRPKRLTGNISQTPAQPNLAQPPPPRQPRPQHQQQLQQPFNTTQYGRPPPAVPPNRGAAGGASSNQHHITYNLSNCFPKSYTEYYQHQQQQQQQQNDCPASSAPQHNIINSNPFLAATNFRKFETATGAATGSMQRAKRKHLLDRPEVKKFYSLKFSAKQQKQEAGVHPAAAALEAAPSAGNKCQRHHSFAGGSLGDVPSNVPAHASSGCPLIYATATPCGKASLRFYDPPSYENLNDSVQIHEYQLQPHLRPPASTAGYHATAVLLHPQPRVQLPHTALRTVAASTVQKRKHHQRQHQQKDDFNLIEAERLSIHRSDSGISNSSYECVTPVATPRAGSTAGSTPPPSKMPKTARHAASKCSLVNSAAKNSFTVAKKSPRSHIIAATPLYMNVDGQPVLGAAHTEHCSSPTSTLVNSSYESASSSTTTTNGGGSADPTSLSSSNSLYSSGTGRRARQQEAAELTTPEEFEQFQLGHRTHSASSASLASSVSAKKCKRRQAPSAATATLTGCLSGYDQEIPPTPFAAAALRQRPTEPHPEAHKNPVNSSCHEANNNNAKQSTTCAEKSRQQQRRLQQDYDADSSGIGRCSYQQQVLMPQQLLVQQQRGAALATPTPRSSQKAEKNSNVQWLHKSHSAQNINELAAPFYNQGEGDEQPHDGWHQPGARPIRLPLRKHHSFNFQPSQTVAGIKKCQLRQMRLQQQQQQFTLPQQQGLILQTYTLNEKHSFKPIETPLAAPENVAAVDAEANDDSESSDDGDATPTPERMGTMGHYFQSESSPSSVASWRAAERTTDDFTFDTNGNRNDAVGIFRPTLASAASSNLMTLHPAAASLEALEALSKANPQLIYPEGAARRKNLHTQLTHLEAVENSRNARERRMVSQLRATLKGDEAEWEREYGAAAADEEDDDDEEEDLGYTYSEDECDDVLHSSPNARVFLTADGGQVQYVAALEHSFHEVHI